MGFEKKYILKKLIKNKYNTTLAYHNRFCHDKKVLFGNWDYLLFVVYFHVEKYRHFVIFITYTKGRQALKINHQWVTSLKMTCPKTHRLLPQALHVAQCR